MGGGGDAGQQARQDEADRQGRITAAVSKINEIFDGKPVLAGDGLATSYNPNQAYFDKDGKSVALPTYTQASSNQDYWNNTLKGISPQQKVDENAVMGMINGGQLFTGTKSVAPAPRDKLYADQKQAVFDINKIDIDNQYKEAERGNRFGLARAGLMGGSADVDSNALIQRKTNEGLLKAGGLGDSAAADLKLADERSRQGLISMAQSGIDTGTAQTLALRGLEATQQQAQGARTGATIGNLFGDLGQAYMIGQVMKGQNSGANMFPQQSTGVSNPRTTYSGDRS